MPCKAMARKQVRHGCGWEQQQTVCPVVWQQNLDCPQNAQRSMINGQWSMVICHRTAPSVQVAAFPALVCDITSLSHIT
jgi:hypothetical protein